MMKRGMTFLLSSAAVVAMTAGFAGVANAGAGGCCDQVEDLQRQIYLLQSQIDELKANPGGLSPKWKAAPQWSEDGMSFKVRGRIMADYGILAADTTGNDESYHGSEFRRARLGVEGKIQKSTKYKFEVSFEPDSGDDPSTAIEDAYIEQKFNGIGVKIGQFKTPNSLEEQTSSRYITFIERAAITDAFGLDRRMGVGTGFKGDNWTFNFGAFGENADTARNQEGYAFAARGTFAPIAEKTKSVHLGASVRYRGFEDDDDVRYRQRAAQNHTTSQRFVNTGNFDADSDLTYGVEAAGVWGPFSLQGEYMRVSANTDSGSDPDFYGWYVDASVFLTGESRSYKGSKGSFGRVKVANPVNEGGLGAWQLAVRYDYIDLTDDGAGFTDTGEQSSILANVNWHLNNYTRFMLGYGYSDIDDAAGVQGNGDVQAVTFRAQIDW